MSESLLAHPAYQLPAIDLSRGHCHCFLRHESTHEHAPRVSKGTFLLGPKGTFELGRYTLGVNDIAVSPDGTLLVSCGEDQTIGGALVNTVSTPSGWEDSLAFSTDVTLLVTGGNSDGNAVVLWSMPACTPAKTLRGHLGEVEAVAITPDQSLVASGGLDETIRLWHVADGGIAGIIKECERPGPAGSNLGFVHLRANVADCCRWAPG